jgi:HAD superfamily phosphatase (TIGR01668 family)
MLRPAYVVHKITDISYNWLKKQGIDGLLVDIDNTVTPYHSNEIPEENLNWFYALVETGIKFIPYSNARKHRIDNFCSVFDIPNPGIAIKPLNFGLKRTLRISGLKKDKVLLIGDQVFTDCLAGKFSGIRTVLVDPVSKNEFPLTKIMRLLERIAGRSRWKYDELKVE